MKKSKSHQFSWQTAISHLPTDNIFSRLSLPDLQKSQLVCKHWYKILNSNHNCLLLCCTNNNRSKLYTVIYSGDGFETPLKARIVDAEEHLPKRFRIVGSAKGRVCLASICNYSEFYVLNPITRKVLKLPFPHTKPRDRDYYLPCGFAYDETTNTHKLVCIVSSSTGRNGVKTKIEICSFANYVPPKWKRIQDHPSFVSRNASSMVLLNGALHWLGKDTEFVSRHRNSDIVGLLDVASESFQMFATPARSACNSLGVLSDSLCICGELEDRCKIWVMKDYGVETSWTLEYSFQKEILGPLHKLDCVSVVSRMSNGGLLLHCGEDQGYYDFEEDEFKKIVFESAGKRLRSAHTEIINYGVNLTTYMFFNF